MVEAGLGVSIVPLMADGAVTRGRKVASARSASESAPSAPASSSAAANGSRRPAGSSFRF